MSGLEIKKRPWEPITTLRAADVTLPILSASDALGMSNVFATQSYAEFVLFACLLYNITNFLQGTEKSNEEDHCR